MLIALALILLIWIAVLALPFGAGLKSEQGKQTWYIILMGLRICVPYRAIAITSRWIHKTPSKPVKPKSKEAVERLARKPKQPGKYTLSLHALQTAWGTMRWFLKRFHFRLRRFDLTVASPDPALTGMAYGLACAVQSVLPSRWPISIGVDFNRETPELAFHVELTVIPASFLLGGLWMILKLRKSMLQG
jgi:hypothetical protein